MNNNNERRIHVFNNPRYITQGINETVPLSLQLLMWNMIDTMQVSQKDYLQVFELSEEDGKQKIIHKQEQPEYEKTHLLDIADASFLYAKIFVIDDETHSTMLLASEY